MTDSTQNTRSTFQNAERSSAQIVGDIARQGADAMRRTNDGAVEATRHSAQAVAEGQREFAKNAAAQFADTREKMAEAIQSTTENLRAFMALPNVAKGGFQDLQQAMTGIFEGFMRTNLKATQEMFRLYDPGALIELQQRFAREYLDTFMQGTATLVRAARRTADETLPPLEQQIEQRRQALQSEQRYQHAAE